MNHIHHLANIKLGQRNTSHTAVIGLIQGLGTFGPRMLEVGDSSGDSCHRGHSPELRRTIAATRRVREDDRPDIGGRALWPVGGV